MLVSIVTVSMRDEHIENILQNYNRQVYSQKELIIVLNKDTMNLKDWRNKTKDIKGVKIAQLPEQVTLGACLNYAGELAAGKFIAKFDDDDYYGPFYLTHIMEDFAKHQDVSVVGKTAYYLYLKNKGILLLEKSKGENQYTSWVAGATLVFKKELFQYFQFENVNRAVDWYFLQECKKHRIKIYSTNKENFTTIRRDPQNHTWKKTDEEFLKNGNIIAYTDNFELFVSTSK